jgi:hypothetical protein
VELPTLGLNRRLLKTLSRSISLKVVTNLRHIFPLTIGHLVENCACRS